MCQNSRDMEVFLISETRARPTIAQSLEGGRLRWVSMTNAANQE
jgi:hypothetical protein